MAGSAMAAVTAQQATLNGYAASALSAAQTALAELAATDIGYVTGIGSLPMGPFTPTPVTVPPLPPAPSIGAPPPIAAVSAPTKPTRPSITQPTAPSINIPAIPPTPGISIPTMGYVASPSLLSISIPNTPVIDFPSFDVAAPDPIELNAPEWAFPIDNILVSDDPMVETLLGRLRNNISKGGTGLTPAVEAAIWDRDLERMEQQLSDSTDKITSMWAKKGFSLPDGLLAHSLSEVQKEYLNKKIDRSREIAIEQAKLEQVNLFKSMEIAVGLVSKLIEETIRHADLVFRTQEATAKFFNEYLKLRIETHNSIIEVFKARVQMYDIRVRSNLAKVEVFKAQIEGEMAKANVNESAAKLYSTQILAAIEQYKGMLEGGDIMARIFTAQIQGVLAQSQVNESLIKAYAEQVRATIAQAEVYKAEVEGMTAEIGVEKVKVEAATAQVMGWAKGADAQIAAYVAGIELFKATSLTNVAIAEMADKAGQVNITAQIASAQVQATVADAVGRSMAAAYSMKMEAAKGVAQTTASMAAGAMAAVHAQAAMSYGEVMTLEEA